MHVELPLQSTPPQHVPVKEPSGQLPSRDLNSLESALHILAQLTQMPPQASLLSQVQMIPAQKHVQAPFPAQTQLHGQKPLASQTQLPSQTHFAPQTQLVAQTRFPMQSQLAGQTQLPTQTQLLAQTQLPTPTKLLTQNQPPLHTQLEVQSQLRIQNHDPSKIAAQSHMTAHSQMSAHAQLLMQTPMPAASNVQAPQSQLPAFSQLAAPLPTQLAAPLQTQLAAPLPTQLQLPPMLPISLYSQLPVDIQARLLNQQLSQIHIASQRLSLLPAGQPPAGSQQTVTVEKQRQELQSSRSLQHDPWTYASETAPTGIAPSGELLPKQQLSSPRLLNQSGVQMPWIQTEQPDTEKNLHDAYLFLLQHPHLAHMSSGIPPQPSSIPHVSSTSSNGPQTRMRDSNAKHASALPPAGTSAFQPVSGLPPPPSAALPIARPQTQL